MFCAYHDEKHKETACGKGKLKEFSVGDDTDDDVVEVDDGDEISPSQSISAVESGPSKSVVSAAASDKTARDLTSWVWNHYEISDGLFI